MIRLNASPRDLTGRAFRRALGAPLAAVFAAALCLFGAERAAAEPVTAGSDATMGPKISTFTLENGLKGVVIEDHRAPVVTHMVWYKVGAADEPPGKSGIAHFLEHLMFKGTDEIPPGEFSKIVAANGGQDNAFTSSDYTAYFQRIAKDRLGMVMKMEADRMSDLLLRSKDVETERDVVLEERSSRTDNDPQGQFYEQFNAALYMNHPYGLPVIGWRHEIEALGHDDVVEFYKLFYGPENATLVVAGDVTPEEVERLAKAHYGPVEPTGVRPLPRPTEPPHRAERRISMAHERVRQPYVMRSYLAPSYVSAKGRDGVASPHALSLLSEILGGGVTSRLGKELVLGKKIAMDAGAYYRGMSRDDGSFTLYAVPVDGVSLEEVEAAADDALARLAAEGPTAEELERAKMVLISSRIYSQDSQSSMARTYGSALTIGLTVDDVRLWPERLRAVTAEDVKAAAASLDLAASVTGHLKTAKPKPAKEAAAAREEVEG